MQVDVRYASNESLPYMSSLAGGTMGLLDSFSSMEKCQCANSEYLLFVNNAAQNRKGTN